MNSQDLRQTMKSLLGTYASDSFPYDDTASKLTDRETCNGLRLSPYGFVMWALDHFGPQCAFKNVLSSDVVVNGYASDALKHRDDMPAMLVNAHTYVSSIMANVADLDTCFRQLEGMTYPHVLYILFAGSGQKDVVERYRDKALEHIRRYPSTLDKLPESYADVGKELMEDADAEQR